MGKLKDKKVKEQNTINEAPKLVKMKEGLTLVSGELQLTGDYGNLLPRVKGNQINGEMIVKAVKIKDVENENLVVLDATAGLGEDSFILGAAGFQVILCERNDVIFSLLEDTYQRALEDEELQFAANNMDLIHGSSIDVLRAVCDGEKIRKSELPAIDVVLLDPMFPEKTKNSLTNKKLQLFQKLEMPCTEEEELFDAAQKAHPRKIVVKRPLKGPYLCGKKPNHSIEGKTVRYDCYLI